MIKEKRKTNIVETSKAFDFKWEWLSSTLIINGKKCWIYKRDDPLT
jgi:hypothetical protein